MASIKCIGSRKFYIKSINKFCLETNNFKSNEEQIQYQIDHPYQDIMEIKVSMYYNIQTNKIYNQVNGMVGNMSGDFFWNSEYILKVLLANDVPEEDIPPFIKNYKDIEKMYLSEIPNIVPEIYPPYIHKYYDINVNVNVNVNGDNN